MDSRPPSVVCDILKYTPEVCRVCHRISDDNIKPCQASKLPDFLSSHGNFVGTYKYDGHGQICYAYTNPATSKWTVNIASRNRQVPCPYMSKLLNTSKIPAGITSFAFAFELVAYVDETRLFHNLPYMNEMGYEAVIPTLKLCEKTPPPPFLMMAGAAFRLIHVNFYNMTNLKKEDELRILGAILEGQRHFFVVKWFLLKINAALKQVMIQDPPDTSEWREACGIRFFEEYLYRLTGDREGLVLFVNDTVGLKPPMLDSRQQYRDPNCVKVRKNFKCTLEGFLRVGLSENQELALCCDRDRATDIELYCIRSKFLDVSVRKRLEAQGGKVNLKVTAANLSITMGKRGFPVSKLLGVHPFMPISDEPVTHIDDIKRQRPQWQISYDLREKSRRLMEEYRPPSPIPVISFVEPAAVKAEPAPPVEPPAPFQLKPGAVKVEPLASTSEPAADGAGPAEGKKESKGTVYVWERIFTKTNVATIYTRMKRNGYKEYNTRNRFIDYVLVHTNAGYWRPDGTFADWYKSICDLQGNRPPIYKVENVDPAIERSANAKYDYIFHSHLYKPYWMPKEKKHRQPKNRQDQSDQPKKRQARPTPVPEHPLFKPSMFRQEPEDPPFKPVQSRPVPVQPKPQEPAPEPAPKPAPEPAPKPAPEPAPKPAQEEPVPEPVPEPAQEEPAQEEPAQEEPVPDESAPEDPSDQESAQEEPTQSLPYRQVSILTTGRLMTMTFPMSYNQTLQCQDSHVSDSQSDSDSDPTMPYIPSQPPASIGPFTQDQGLFSQDPGQS